MLPIFKVLPTDWDKLRSLDVRTIIDLRGAEENQRLPVLPPVGISYVPLKLISQKPVPPDGEHDPQKGGSFIASLIMKYSWIVRSNLSGVAELLSIINKALDTGSVVFFCSAGKDRTGITAATILYLCGVPEDDITADYMVTYEYDSNQTRGVYPKLTARMDLSAYGGKLPEPLVKSSPEVIRELLEYYNTSDIRAILNDKGFSYESQSELIRKMVE